MIRRVNRRSIMKLVTLLLVTAFAVAAAETFDFDSAAPDAIPAGIG